MGANLQGHCVVIEQEPESAPITQLLQRWRAGDDGAANDLMPLVYQQLRVMARRQLGRSSDQVTLVPTELVHEAYMRLGISTPDAKDRHHFFAVAARAMRQVLVAHERHRLANKRDGGQRVSLSSLDLADSHQEFDLLAIDQALSSLAEVDNRLAQVIELRAFAGLDFNEIAEFLGISRATLARDFRAGRAWMYKALSMQPPAPATS